MNRKKFLSGLAAISAIPLGIENLKHFFVNENEAAFKQPAFLQKGDIIGITSPAGYINNEGILAAANKIQEWGYKLKIGKTIGKRHFTLGGTDDERLEDFQELLDDSQVKAILCARGGYGFVRIIDRLDFSKFRKNPKWIIGFSDITVLHSHINSRLKIASIHSKMCNSFPDSWEEATEVQRETILSLRDILSGKKMKYTAAFNAANRTGRVKGIITGGNLRTIETLAGTNSEIDTKGKILFVEDVGEYLYSIDRMFWNLKRSGKLKDLKGLIIGGFRIKKEEDPDSEFGMNLEEIVMEKVKEYSYPVCFNFPVGHQRDNFAIMCGGEHELIVESTGTELRSV